MQYNTLRESHYWGDEMGDCGVILVVDHDRAFCSLAAKALARMDFVVVAAEDAESAFARLDGARPDLAIVEVELPGLNGLALLTQLLEAFDDGLPVILTSAERGAPLDRAAGLLLGADDYIVKPVDPGELVARVGRSLRRSAMPGNGAEGPRDATLSSRERQILGLLANGRTQKEIAATLVISSKTVGTHIQHVLSKLGVHSRAQAVAAAYRLRIVDGDFQAHAVPAVGTDEDGRRLTPPPVAVV